MFPLLLKRYTGAALGTLLYTGGLAALMSTMDSQLLTLTSLVTVDLLGIQRRRTSWSGWSPSASGCWAC